MTFGAPNDEHTILYAHWASYGDLPGHTCVQTARHAALQQLPALCKLLRKAGCIAVRKLPRFRGFAGCSAEPHKGGLALRTSAEPCYNTTQTRGCGTL
jgi:hypothetical protein